MARRHAVPGVAFPPPAAKPTDFEPPPLPPGFKPKAPFPPKSAPGGVAPLPIPPPKLDTPPGVGLPPKAIQRDGAQVGDPPAKSPARVEPAGDDAPGDGPELYFRGHGPYATVFLVDNRTLLHIPGPDQGPEAMPSLLGQLLRRKADGPLAEALAEAGKHTIVAGLRVRPLEEVVRLEGDLPRELMPFRSLLKAKTVMVTADIAAKTTVTAKLTFADAAMARRAEPVFKTLIQHGVDALADLRKEVARDAERSGVLTPLIDLASAALDKAEVRTDGTFVIARAEAEIGPAVSKAMAALPDLIEIANAKAKTLNNLKQIGLACHNFHDTYGYMPANIVGPDRKVLFSWRVAILPFMEQDNLYRQLDLTKPWDDPKNAKLLANMPNLFRVYGRDAEKGKTFLQMPASPQAIAGGSPFLVHGRRTTFANITDGTSNTIMVVEAAEAVNWAKPDDLRYEPAKAPKVGSPDRKWFYAAFGDGSVRTLRRDRLTDDQLRALFTTDGGEVVEIPDR
jgi:hypothetical protein